MNMSIINKGIVVLLLAFFGISINAFSLNKHDSIPVYRIENNDLTMIIDSFVKEANQYDDFNNILYLSILSEKGDVLQLSYVNDREVLSINDNMKNGSLGIVLYDSVFILMYGRAVINNAIMKKTEKCFNIMVNKRTDLETVRITPEGYFFPIKWLIGMKDDKLVVLCKSDRTQEE